MTTASDSAFRDPRFVALAGTAFARAQAYSTILIALALYADLFDTSGVIEGLFGTAFALAQFVIVLPLGRALDRGDARRFLLAGLGISVGVMIGFALVESATHVILVRIVQGVGATILWVTGSTLAGQLGPPDDRGQWLGSYNQVGAFSSLAGDLVGGYLLFVHGFTVTYAVLAVILVSVLLLVWRLLPRSPGGPPDDGDDVETIRALLGRPPIAALVAFRSLFSMGKMIVLLFLPIYARTAFGLNALAIGGVLAGGKLSKSLLQGWTGRLTDRGGRHESFIVVGALVYALAAAAIPLAGFVEGAFASVRLVGAGQVLTITPPLLTLFLAFALAGVGDSIRLPASMVVFVEEGSVYDAAGSSMSLRSIAWKVGQIGGPLLAGILVDLVAIAAAFWLAAGAIIAAIGAYWLLRWRLSDGEPDTV